jgi:hypothetical protein
MTSPRADFPSYAMSIAIAIYQISGNLKLLSFYMKLRSLLQKIYSRLSGAIKSMPFILKQDSQVVLSNVNTIKDGEKSI